MTAADSDGAAARDEAMETYNHWTIVNLVFSHLADEGLHPVLGESGDPAGPARALLESLGIRPDPSGNQAVRANVRDQLAELRAAFDET